MAEERRREEGELNRIRHLLLREEIRWMVREETRSDGRWWVKLIAKLWVAGRQSIVGEAFQVAAAFTEIMCSEAVTAA